MRGLGSDRLELIDALVAESNLGEVRDQIGNSLRKLGFVEEADKAVSLNERRYLHSQWSYRRNYVGASGLAASFAACTRYTHTLAAPGSLHSWGTG